MNEQFWSKVTEGIDEKFADEAAEYFAKHAPAEYGSSDCMEYTAAPVKLSPEKENGKKRRLWVGIGSAAAALALCVAGGVFLMRGGDPLLSVADPTTEVTAESYESSETSEQLVIEVTAEAEVIESAETTDISDPDAWQSLKQYTGDDPETLAFINEISAGALEYQEQFQQNSLENAQDDSYREAAQQAIDEGGLDIMVESAVYAKTDSGDEFWMKAYRIKMAQNAELHEMYYRSEDGFALLHTDDSGWITSCLCDGEALYYSLSNLGIVEKVTSDGSSDIIFSAHEEAPDDSLGDSAYLWAEDISLNGRGEKLTVSVDYMYQSEPAKSIIHRRDTHIFENDELISTSSTGYGYGIINGTAIKYPYSTGDHGHEEVDLTNEDLLWLGQLRFNAAVMLHQIMHKVPEGDESDRYDENYIALDKRYFTTKHSMHDSISDLYDYTFAQDVYAYEDGEYVYFAVKDPEKAPWLDGSYHDDITLKEHIESRLRYHNGKTYALSDGSDESTAAWTDLVGVLDYEEGVYVDYLLCTTCHNGKGGYIYEHSVMRLECFEGVWLITQLRSHLGNEYKRNFEGLVDAPQTAVDIFERDLLKPNGYTLMCDTKLDFDLDGEEELLLLAGKNSERSIFVFDKIYNDWHFTEQLTDEHFSGMSTLDAHRYSNGDRDGWFFVNGVVPEEASLVMTEFAPNSDEYDLNGGSYIITDMPLATEADSGHLCCIQALKDAAGDEFGKAVLDTDNDGREEVLVHFGYSLYVFEEVDGYLIQQQEFGYDTLMQADISSEKDELVIYRYQGENSGFLFFEFPYSDSYKQATVTAAIKHNGRDGYYIEYLCSAGTLEGEPFYRYGWDFTDDWHGKAPFSPISESTYNDYRSRLFFLHDLESGLLPEDVYTVPAALPSVVYHTPQWEEFYTSPTTDEDIYWIAVELAEKLLGQLEGYGVGKTERTFSIDEYKDVKVDFCRVSEADSRWNVTDEEKALSDAWIVDISAEFRYTGEINGIASDDWCSDLYDENIGFLMYRKGNTFIMKTRYYNGSDDIASPETIKTYAQSTLLKAQELCHIVYFSGNEARTAGCRNVYDNWYELPESFPYNSIEEIEDELLKYYTEDTVEAVNVEYWFSVINGKLCARTYDKGANVITYHDLDEVEVLLQHGDDIWLSVPVMDATYYESYVHDVHMVLQLEDWKHIIMLF